MKQETRDQLREILCEVPEVEKDVKEVKKGCIVNDTDFGTGRAEIFGEYNANTFIVIRELEKERPHLERKTDIEDWEIIGNPLQERYLRMYCENKGILGFFGINKIELWIPGNESNALWCRIDNTKDLEDQSEETGQKLIKFLLDNK